MLTAFEPRQPDPLRPVPAAESLESRARQCEADGNWAGAGVLWRDACGCWSRAGDRLRAEWALSQAGRCELELDPTYRELKAAGQVKTVRLGEGGPGA